MKVSFCGLYRLHKPDINLLGVPQLSVGEKAKLIITPDYVRAFPLEAASYVLIYTFIRPRGTVQAAIRQSSHLTQN